MSRSYKKNPYCTDGHRRTTKETKQLANRCVRRRNKRVTLGYLTRDSKYRDILTLDGMSYKKFFCSYDIHDYVTRWSKAEALHDYEHPHMFWIQYKDGTGEWWSRWLEYDSVKFFRHQIQRNRRFTFFRQIIFQIIIDANEIL